MNVDERELLKLMAQGYELGCSYITGNFWAQLDGLGSGRPSRNVKAVTVDSLLNKGKIKLVSEEPGLPKKYALS